jgi:hypothetical protein
LIRQPEQVVCSSRRRKRLERLEHAHRPG